MCVSYACMVERVRRVEVESENGNVDCKNYTEITPLGWIDGAFYRPHSTQARSSRLKCEHYGNVNGEYFYLTKHFSCRLLLCMHFFAPLQENLNQKMTHLRVWEYFYCPSDLYLMLLNSLKFKLENEFNTKHQTAPRALSLLLWTLHFPFFDNKIFFNYFLY